MKILVVSDIFGKPGRQAVKKLLPGIIEREKIDFVVVNAENAAGGKGLNPKTAEELFKLPIDVMTSGNHIWEYKTLHPYFETHNILRPLNTKEELPGRGWGVFNCGSSRIAVVCLQGQIFMDDKGPKVVSPFKVIDGLMETLKSSSDLIVIDFHAEATSEKRAMGWYLDGKVTALLGTHTHIQTADEEILPNGTAYITDLGMTGPHASVIGLDKKVALHRYLTGEKKGFKVAKEGVRLEAVVIDVDEETGMALKINRLQIPISLNAQ